MIRICSGFGPAGRAIYGDRFLATFDQHWPTDVELRVYVEEPMPMPRDAWSDLWTIDDATLVRKRYDSALYQGRLPTTAWKPSAKAAGYNFRFDAFKFFRQMIIPQAASLDMPDGSVLVWLDGDVATIRDVPPGFVEGLLGRFDVVYLGRGLKHSEIGFWAVRLSTLTRQFLHDIAAMYVDGEVLALKEWHSAFVWDHCRRKLGLYGRDLCPNGARGNVFPLTPLAKYMIHDKGRRKPGGSRG